MMTTIRRRKLNKNNAFAVCLPTLCINLPELAKSMLHSQSINGQTWKDTSFFKENGTITAYWKNERLF